MAATSARAEQQTQRVAAQEQAALARLRVVHDSSWWNAADIRQVGDTWQIVDAYRGRPDAVAVREVMAREVTSRWGVTPGVDADSAAVRRLLEQAEQGWEQERAEVRRAMRDRNITLADEEGAARDDRHAQQANDTRPTQPDEAASSDRIGLEQARVRADTLDRQAADGYDSAEQRRARAEGYAQSGHQHATEARILADESNALPAAYATRSRVGRRRRPSRGPHQPRPGYRVVGDRSW